MLAVEVEGGVVLTTPTRKRVLKIDSVWRRGRDSNPRRIAPYTISSRNRKDRVVDTISYRVHWLRPREAQEQSHSGFI